MRLTDSELRDLRRSATVPASRGGCPSADQLARGAMGELPDAERDALVDHLTGCAACAGEYRTIAPVRAAMSEAGTAAARRRLVPAAYAAAAAVIAAVGLGSATWTTMRLRETERQLAAAPIVDEARPPRVIPQVLQPQLNVPILDVSPRDPLRGGPDTPDREQRLVVPAQAPTFVLILTTATRASDPTYTLEIVNTSGAPVWNTEGLRAARDGTFTLTMPSSGLPAGSYRFLLKRAPSAGATLIEEYLVRIEYS